MDAQYPVMLNTRQGLSTGALLKGAAALAPCLLALSLFTNTIIDSDIWWHLRTGKYIFENRVIPGADMYSYTAAGNRWIDLHWLFQTILYGTYETLGSYGLSILFILVFSACFTLVWFACNSRKNHPAALLMFWLGLMACSARYLARPEAFTYLMIAAFMLLLTRFEKNGGWSIFVLIPLQAVWTNMQGLFILGPFLVSAYAAPEIGAVLYSRLQKKDIEPHRYKKASSLAVAAVGSVAACLLNPYGLEGLLFPLTLFTRAGGIENIFAGAISELQPPLSGYNLTTPLKYFAAFIALSGIALAADYKNLRLSHIIIFGGTAYLAISARRSVPVFVVAILPIAVEHASNVLDRLRTRLFTNRATLAQSTSIVLCLAFCIALALQITSVVTNKYYIADKRAERFGFGFKEQLFPHAAFAFLKENGVRGPFFNNLDIGGLFIWEMYPGEKVFIDPRLEVNTAEVFADYRRAMAQPPSFAALSDKYSLNAVVISHTSQDALFLVPVLYYSPDWKLVYLDPLAAVFVRNSERNADLIGTNAIDMASDEVPILAPDDLNDTAPTALRRLFDKLAPTDGSDLQAQNLFNLGLVFLVSGLPEHAASHFEAGLKLMPLLPEGHYNLGLAYERMGRADLALAHYVRTLELDSGHALAHANLGRLYDEQGLTKQAEKHYRLAIRCGGDAPIPLFNLGAIYYEKGDREAARKYWQRALQADPSFAPAMDALKQLE
jgi:tetratricopeptide (TPR) repeat protein